MGKSDNFLKIDIEYSMKEFKRYPNEQYFVYLLCALRNEYLYVPVQKDELIIREDDDSPILKRNYEFCPVFVTDSKLNVSFASFTKKERIPESFLEKYSIIRMRLKDLAIDCLEKEDVYGVSINHKSDSSITLNKQILQDIIHHL